MKHAIGTKLRAMNTARYVWGGASASALGYHVHLDRGVEFPLDDATHE
jgi:hypothetical protein